MSAKSDTVCQGCGCPLIRDRNGKPQHDERYKLVGRTWHLKVPAVNWGTPTISGDDSVDQDSSLFKCCKDCGETMEFKYVNDTYNGVARKQLRCEQCGSIGIFHNPYKAIEHFNLLAKERLDKIDYLEEALADGKTTSKSWYEMYYKERKQHRVTIWAMVALFCIMFGINILFKILP